MKLYKIEASNWETFFGPFFNPIKREGKDYDVIRIAQTPNCDAFLFLSKDAQDGLELLNSVPAGFDFTYCQEWGLTVDAAVIDRAIADIPSRYPEMVS